MSIQAETLRELESLRDRVAELEYELARRDEDVDLAVATVTRHFTVPISQARIIVTMSDGRIHSRARLIEDTSYAESDHLRNIDSVIKRLRRTPSVNCVLEFKSHYGLGYRLTSESAAYVCKIIKAERESLVRGTFRPQFEATISA